MSTLIESTDIEIVVEGRVLKSNLDTFCTQLKGVIGLLDRELSTDADFESADKDARFLKSAEKSLKSAKDEALKQAEDIQNLFAAIDDVSEEARQARLGLERQIKARKTERRKEILDSYEARIAGNLGRVYRPSLDAAMSGKRTFESMEQAVVEETNRINEKINKSQSILTQFLKKHGKTLIPDSSALLQKPAEELTIELERRVERAEAEAERKRLEAEIAAQKAEAKAKAEAEAKARAEAEKQKREAESSAKVEEIKAPEAAKREPNRVEVFDVEQAKKVKADEGIEYANYIEAVRLALMPLRDARSQLKYPANIEKAKVFAVLVNEAWKELTGGAS